MRRAPIDDIDAVRDAGARAHYDDPSYYARAYARRRRDVEFYVRLAGRVGGPVLEYGVGNGRVAVPIAKSGIEVVGIDHSRPMLDHLSKRLARERPAVRARLTAVHGDMKSVRLRRRFALVIAPFNTILHLYERQDMERFLACVRAHLLPGARFVFDYSLPSPIDLGRDPAHAMRCPSFRHPESGELIRYSERFEYHPLRQLLVVWMDFSPAKQPGRSWSVPLSHRQFFPQEIQALLHYNGFCELELSGDFSGRPPDETTDSLVVSCRARRAGQSGVARARRRA